MTEFRQSWRLGGLNLRLVEGDLFDVGTAAIVNSEQTNFVLAANESTISGQIRRRLGKSIQEELNEQTGGMLSPPGTVLVTGGSPLFEKVYHAGFHEPWVWLDADRDDAETEHVQSIRQCIRITLQRLFRYSGAACLGWIPVYWLTSSRRRLRILLSLISEQMILKSFWYCETALFCQPHLRVWFRP
jgi:hypothetical protein